MTESRKELGTLVTVDKIRSYYPNLAKKEQKEMKILIIINIFISFCSFCLLFQEKYIKPPWLQQLMLLDKFKSGNKYHYSSVTQGTNTWMTTRPLSNNCIGNLENLVINFPFRQLLEIKAKDPEWRSLLSQVDN